MANFYYNVSQIKTLMAIINDVNVYGYPVCCNCGMQ